MQPIVPNKPMAPQYQPPHASASSGGRACGCFALGCGGSVLLLVALCGIGYYMIVHTAMPLKWIEAAIEEDGNVEIEGLEGNFNTGIEIQKLRFKDTSQLDRATGQPRWSELTDIKAKYKGGGFMSDSLTIEEISVGGGTIYGDIDFDSESGGEMIFAELQEELGNIRNEIGNGSGSGSIEVKLISVSNLRICDVGSDAEFRIEDVRLEDVVFENNRLVEFGDLVVRADNIELTTEKTSEFPQADLERTLHGRISKGLLSNLLSDIPFTIRFGVLEDGALVTKSDWFDGQIRFASANGDSPAEYTIDGFSPGERLLLSKYGVLPSEIHFAATYDLKRRLKIANLESDGSFTMGQTRFSSFELPDESDGTPDLRVFNASAQVAGRAVEAQVYILAKMPLLGVKLREAGDWSLKDTWAQTVYGKTYDELKGEEQELIDANIESGKRKFTTADTPAESVDPAKPDEPPAPDENRSADSDKAGDSESSGSSGDEDKSPN